MMDVKMAEPSVGEYRVRTEGHADTPEVCAAASALMQTLQGWMHAADIVIKEERIGAGDCELRFKGVDPCDKLKCHTAYEMLCIGFLRLHATAPNEIRVIISGRPE